MADREINTLITLSAFADEFAPDLETQMKLLAAEEINRIDLRTVGGINVLRLSDQEVQHMDMLFLRHENITNKVNVLN